MPEKRVEKKERAKIGGMGEWAFAGVMEVLIAHPNANNEIRQICDGAMKKIEDPVAAAAFINKCTVKKTFNGESALCCFSIRDQRVHEEVKRLMLADGGITQNGTAPRGYWERTLEVAQGEMWRRNRNNDRAGGGPAVAVADDEAY
jgi:hypothetical protein